MNSGEWAKLALKLFIKDHEVDKTQTAVINILNLFIFIMTCRFVCALHTFSKVTVEI